MIVQVFADLDGPLLDVRDRYTGLHRDLVESLGGRPLAADAYWRGKRRRIPERTLVEQCGIGERWKEYIDRRSRLIESPDRLALDRVWTAAATSLRRITADGSVHIVTHRQNQRALSVQMESVGIAAWATSIECVTLTSNPVHAKAQRFRAIARKGGHRGSTYVIGDTETDVRAGRLVGAKVIAVAYGIREPVYLSSLHPDCLVESADELAALLDSLEASG